jgi:hypothetical protein
MAVAFGQPGFFSPNAQTWLPSERISFYSTSALKATLERIVDFDRINDGKEMRLSVGAVNVETSQFAYFRQPGDENWPGARDGKRCVAARISVGRSRR